MKPYLQRSLRSAAFLLAATLSVPAVAQSEVLPNLPAPRDEMPAAKRGSFTGSDFSFAEKAAKAGLREVAVSQEVKDKLMNPRVREFAEMMVKDHSAVNRELQSLASNKGATL